MKIAMQNGPPKVLSVSHPFGDLDDRIGNYWLIAPFFSSLTCYYWVRPAHPQENYYISNNVVYRLEVILCSTVLLELLFCDRTDGYYAKGMNLMLRPNQHLLGSKPPFSSDLQVQSIP